MTTYYGGNRATTNTIRPLNASSFRELVTGYLNATVALPHTRRAYFAMDEKRQREVKNGPYLCACSFRDGTTERCDRNAERLVFVVLDLDTPGDTSVPIQSYLREIHDNPDIAIGALHPWSAAIYTTASSTPERPRLRVMVEADLPPGKQVLRAAVRTICDRLGIPEQFKGAGESTVLSQPWFRPVSFADDPDTHSPVLASRVTGTALTEADIEATAAAEGTRVYSWSGGMSPDDPAIGLDQLPVRDIRVSDIIEPLNAIDPDSDYHIWVNLVAALRHQFREEEEARDAYDAFDAWSARGTKYTGEAETYGKWKSFRPDAIGKRCVTLRTLFKFAQDAGWKPSRLAEQTRKGFEDWLEAQTCSHLLTERFAKRLLSLPFLNPILQDSLLEKVRRKMIQLDGTQHKIGSLVKMVEAARKEIVKEARESQVENWLKPYCYITAMGKWVHMNKGVEMAMTDTAFLTKHALNAGDSSPLETARRTKDVRMPDSVAYDPREDAFFTFRGVDYFNEYRCHPIPETVAGDTAGPLIDNHLLTLCGEKWIADTVLWFLACLVQKPGEKIRWLPVIQSGEGAGKTLLANLVGAAIGESNVKVLSPAVMQTGAWNDWAYGCQLVVIEELMIKGKSREEVANTYKEFITNNTIALTRKFENSRTVPNVANAIAFTNSHSPIHLSESNRRYMFIKSPLQTRQHIADLTASGYFQPLNELLKRPGEIRHHLMNVAIPADFPIDGPAPMTRFNRYLINESRNRASDAILDAIQAGDDPRIQPDIVDADHATRKLERHLSNNHPVQHWLPEHGYEPWLDGERVKVHGERVQLWVRAGWDVDVDGDPVKVMEGRTKKDALA